MASKTTKINVTGYGGDISESVIETPLSYEELSDSVGGGSLPEVSSTDNGDVLTVVEGDWNKASVPVELPAVSSDDNGNVLTVVEGEWAKASVPAELPVVSSTDNGNVLTVVEGEWAKAAPSGGGGGEGLIANISLTDDAGQTYKYTVDKTCKQISDAIAEGTPVYFQEEETSEMVGHVINSYPVIVMSYSRMDEDIVYSFEIEGDARYKIFYGNGDDEFPISYPTDRFYAVEIVSADGDGQNPETFECNYPASYMREAYYHYGLVINNMMVIAYDESNGYDFTVLDTSGGTVKAITYHADNEEDHPAYTAS